MALNSLMMRNVAKKFIKAHPEYTMERLERIYAANPPVHGVRVGGGVVIIESAVNCILLVKDVVWAYAKRTDIRVNYIPMGHPIHVELWTRQSEKTVVATWTQQKAQELLTYLFSRLPGAVFGHSQELVKLWNSGMNDGHIHFDYVAAAQHKGEE